MLLKGLVNNTVLSSFFNLLINFVCAWWEFAFENFVLVAIQLVALQL